MSYLDTTLVAEAGYTNVHYRQLYEAIAAQLTAHPQWSFVESVDHIAGSSTYRMMVWRNAATLSGLPKDFYVAFRYGWITTTGILHTANSPSPLNVFLWEDYDAVTHIASKIAPTSDSTLFILGADQTHPLTWDLAIARPNAAGAGAAWAGIGPWTTGVTSFRLLIGVTNTGIYLASATGGINQVYAGKFETLLSATDDPVPLILAMSATSSAMGTGGSTAGFHFSTRHPLLTPGESTNVAHSLQSRSFHAATLSAGPFASGRELTASADTAAGELGAPTNLGWSLYQGGVAVSRCMISTGGSSRAGATRGGLRGYFSNLVGAPLAAHAIGDTFLVDGTVYVGLGSSNNGLWDTTA